ncbi:hypothetical protein CK203_035080 [Vitis vinifera]|uniref:RNase H type-1 domain-containing protein n=1 Tax=Vitis vinifera TaxID=29760 RepID=A0A438I9Z8_VITVI|nr:hypothetical protein CK203_035080 [Vitis vinifera]
MAKYLLKVQESLSRLGEWVIEKIPRGDNVQVDTLAGIAASFPVKEVYVQATPTIAESHVCNMSPKECNWAVDIRAYLQTGALLEDPKCAHKIRLIHPDVSRPQFCPDNVLPYSDVSQPPFCPVDIPLSSDGSQPQFYPADVPPSPGIHIRLLMPDGRGGRLNFPGQTCPDPLVTLIRRTSAADNSDSPVSLARQIFAIRRIHFRPQSKG